MQGGREFSYRSNPMVRCSTHATNQSSIGGDMETIEMTLQVIAGPSYDKSLLRCLTITRKVFSRAIAAMAKTTSTYFLNRLVSSSVLEA